jgi:hypothetical protein
MEHNIQQTAKNTNSRQPAKIKFEIELTRNELRNMTDSFEYIIGKIHDREADLDVKLFSKLRLASKRAEKQLGWR